MAVVIIDNRILVNEADSATGWTSSDALTPYTTGPTPKELTSNLGFATSQSEEYSYHAFSSADLSSTLIYIWTLVLGTEQTTANGGRQIYLGDGTHARGYYVGGSDGAGFRHDSGEVNWQCFLLDTANLPAGYTQHAGSTAPSLTAITQIGVGYVVDSKALGGGDNTYVDMALYGNGGLSIVGGTTGDRGTFAELTTKDAANTNYGGTEDASGARSSGTAGSSYGIIRELSSGVYGLSGSFTFGDSAETAVSYFDDEGVVVVFENKITSSYWYFDAEGNSSYNVTFNLSNTTIKSAGPTITCDFTGGNINTLTFDTVSFIDLVGDMDFSNSADATGHSVTDCSFTNCGEIDPGDVTFENNSIIDSADSLTGAVLLDADGSSNWSGLNFVSGGTGHAIYITAGSAHTFSNFTYSGYGGTPGSNPDPGTGSTDAMVYNFTGGAVTLTIVGGDTPSVRNGAGASTTVVQNINVTATIKNQAGTALAGVEVAIFQDNAARTVILASTATDEDGQVATTAAASLGAIIIRARQSTDIASFLTSASGIDDGTDVITTLANHDFQDGDKVTYSRDGGSQNIGIDNDTTWYINNLTATTLSLHPTATDAIANTNKEAITVAGAETHTLDPVRYVAGSATGTIGSSDFSAELTLITDNIATG